MNAKVLIYWILVGIPLSWGLYKSVERSKPLFDGSMNKPATPPAATAPAAPSPAPPK